MLFQNSPRLSTVAIYAQLGVSVVAFWQVENTWLSTTSVLWSIVFFSVATVALWDFWRVREIDRRLSVAKALRDEYAAKMMLEQPTIYLAEKFAGMTDKQVDAFLVAALPLFEDGDELAKDISAEAARRYGWEPTRIEQMNIEDEARVILREAAKHGGQMRPQNTVSGEKRRRLQRVLDYLETQEVIDRPQYNRPVDVNWKRVGELGLMRQ